MGMRYRQLGSTGWEVSEVGLGTYPLGGALETSGSYWAGPATYGSVDREAALATIQAGRARGLNFVDTAPCYGQAEVWIGEALRAGASGRRCLVETKCGEHVRPAAAGAPPELRRDFSRAALRESIERSRQRLRVDRLDLVLLHSPSPEELAEDPIGLLVELREAGTISHLGVSAGSVDHAVWLAEVDGRSEVLQVPFNLLDPRASRQLFPLAAQRGIGIVIRTPLASGYLTGTIGEDHEFAADDYRRFTPREQIVRRVRQAKAFGWLADDGIAGSLPEAALRYILSFPEVSTVIPGAMRPAELEQNLAVADLGPLPAAALDRIRATQEELGLLG